MTVETWFEDFVRNAFEHRLGEAIVYRGIRVFDGDDRKAGFFLLAAKFRVCDGQDRVELIGLFLQGPRCRRARPAGTGWRPPQSPWPT